MRSPVDHNQQFECWYHSIIKVLHNITWHMKVKDVSLEKHPPLYVSILYLSFVKSCSAFIPNIFYHKRSDQIDLFFLD